MTIQSTELLCGCGKVALEVQGQPIISQLM